MCQHVLNRDQTCVLCGLVDGQTMVAGYIPFRRYREKEITNAELCCGSQYFRFHDKGLGSLETQDKVGYRATPFFEMDKLAERLQLSKGTQEEIGWLWRKLRKRDSTRNGRSRIQLLGGLAWLVCRLRRIPRTLREINGAVKELGGKAVDTDVLNYLTTTLNKRPPLPKATDYIDRFGSKLGLSQEQIGRAWVISRRSKGRPDVVAVASCYLAGRGKASRGKVALRKITQLLGYVPSTIIGTAGKIEA